MQGAGAEGREGVGNLGRKRGYCTRENLWKRHELFWWTHKSIRR